MIPLPNWLPQLLDGMQAKYQPESVIAQGAYGLALLARVVELREARLEHFSPVALNDTVIVKVARLDESRTPEDTRRFLETVTLSLDAELGALHRLRDLPGVPKLLDCGAFLHRLNGNLSRVPFIVQEYVQGETLESYAARKFSQPIESFSGIPDARVWFKLAWALADRLVAVHQRETVHRDIWPPNILIHEEKTTDGEIRFEIVFIDFGAAVFRQQISLSVEMRRDVYTAPERIKDWRWPSRRFDIYSLGGVLHYLATGQSPPKAIRDNDELKNRVVEGIKTANPHLLRGNAGIADIIARCLRYDPNNRVRDADSLLLEFQLFDRLKKFPSVEHLSAQIIRHASSVSGRDNDLFRQIAAGELYLLAHRVESMANGVFDLSGDHEEMVSGLTRYLSVLGNGDEYLAVTIPEFWAPENLGINGRFLTMNRLLAERGVKISRLFLVTREDLQGDTLFRAVAAAHLRLQEELPQGTSIGSRFLVVEATDKWDALRQNDHQGAWIQRGEAMQIIPVYDSGMTIRTVRMRRYQGDPKHLKKQLSESIARGQPLEQAFPDANLYVV